jgi:streptogramin lyase
MSRRNGRVAMVIASTAAALLMVSGCVQPRADDALPGIDARDQVEGARASARFPVEAVPLPAQPTTVPSATAVDEGPDPAAGGMGRPRPSPTGPSVGQPPTSTPAPSSTGAAPQTSAPGGLPVIGRSPSRLSPPPTAVLPNRTPASGPGQLAGDPGSVRQPAAPPVAAQVAAPGPRVAVEERVQSVIPVPDADAVAAAGGALWVKEGDGSLGRIDPATNQVVASVAPVSDLPCSGLGGVGNVLWVCAGDGAVVRVDPVTGTQVKRLELGKIPDQKHIPMGFQHAWFLVAGGTQLVGVDHASNAVDVTIDLGSACAAVDASDASLWVACPTDGVVLRVDPNERAVTARVEGLPGARAITAGSYVFVGYDAGTARIDRTTATVDKAVSTGPDDSRLSLYTAGNHLFIRTPQAFLQVLDATTMEIIEEVSTSGLTTGSSVLAFGSLWTTSGEDGSLYRLEPTPPGATATP